MLGSSLATAAGAADKPEKFTFLTNWYAEAEHGGFYQAIAKGLYRDAGLDVTIRMGGAQVNTMQLLAAGQADCMMGGDIQVMKAWENGVHAVTVAATFQKDPQVLIAHDDVKDVADMKTRTILIGTDAHTTYWPWAKSTFGFTDAQTRPYTFNIQPFVADRNIVQQGYLSSEPYSIQKAGVKTTVFLLADLGYPPYSETIICLDRTLQARKAAVAAFVKASMEGWKSYLADPAPADALIKKDNPNQTDDDLSHGVAQMKAMGIVTGGDAGRLGIGVITDARMKKTYDMLVANKLLDPAKVDVKQTYTTEFVKDLRVLP
ncbi:MAG TPA: ABC transporter substrate-binding protein [Burkholderiaceae bacterium]|nr:ABC transporter substrate-binding protein [Burkholderiaceae bacterium]